MPDVPIIIPVLVSGLMLGMAWRKSSKIGVKLLGLGSVLSGLANGGYAYVTNMLGGAGLTNQGAAERLSGSALEVYLLTSVSTGLLIVLAIFGIAYVIGRGKAGEGREEEIEPFLESAPEEETKADKTPPHGSQSK